MVKITVKIDGMMCGMCESHVNDAIRKAFPDQLKKVSSSHGKGQSVILAKEDLDEERLRAAVDSTGYRVLSVKSEPCTNTGLFGFFTR